MIRSIVLAAMMVLPAGSAWTQDEPTLPEIRYSTEYPGEEEIEPHTRSNAHAGATPFEGPAMYAAFNGQAGVARIVEGLLTRSQTDPRSAAIFAAVDRQRLARTLNEQFCYILGGGCDYTGRDMKTAHADLGLQSADMGTLVEHLQSAMRDEGVPFTAQNRFLAKLAPMKRDVVVR